MRSRRPTTTTSARGSVPPATRPLLLGGELVRADVAKSVLGFELGEAPCGGPITWALLVDAVLVGCTDEPLTDDAARAWAHRMLGEGARFQLGHPGGGYWLTDATTVQRPRGGEAGWSR